MVTTTALAPKQPEVPAPIKSTSQPSSSPSTIGGNAQEGIPADTFVSSVSQGDVDSVIREIIGMNSELTFIYRVNNPTKQSIVKLYFAFQGYTDVLNNQVIEAVRNATTEDEIRVVFDNLGTQRDGLSEALEELKNCTELTLIQKRELILTLQRGLSRPTEIPNQRTI
jgi:hypothetical protein